MLYLQLFMVYAVDINRQRRITLKEVMHCTSPLCILSVCEVSLQYEICSGHKTFFNTLDEIFTKGNNYVSSEVRVITICNAIFLNAL